MSGRVRVTSPDTGRPVILQRLRAPDHALAAAPMAPSGSPKLDVLRTVAVLTVVGSHLWFEQISIAYLGRVGVLFFFVHTSLVLMFSLERQYELTGRARLFSAFMLRRVLRIYPLSVVVVTVVYLFELPGRVFLDNRVHAIPIDGTAFVMHLLLVQDMVLSRDQPGPMLGVLWTLPVELRMYLVLPAIFLLTRLVRDLRVLLPLGAVAAVLALLIQRDLIGGVFDNPRLDLDRVTIVAPRILEFVPHFLAGVLAYVLWRRGAPRLPFLTLPLLLSAILIGYYETVERQGGTSREVMIAGMLGCLVLGLLLPWIREPVWTPLRWTCKEIARYSYAIYLVHVPCLWFAFERLAGVPNPLQWVAFIGLVGGLSVLLYVLIERPFIRLGARLGQRWAGAGRARSG